RLSMINSPDLYVESAQEMIESFPQYPDAIENTVKIAEKCNLDIEIGKWYFPVYPLQKGKTINETLKVLTFNTAKELHGNLTQEILDRLNLELDVICSKGYANYFLIMRDFIDWCEINNAPTNTRGSACGSLVSYVLGITSVDPF